MKSPVLSSFVLSSSSVFPVCFVLLFTLLLAGCGGDSGSSVDIKKYEKAKEKQRQAQGSVAYNGIRKTDAAGFLEPDASLAETAVELGAVNVAVPDQSIMQQMANLSVAGVSKGKCLGSGKRGQARGVVAGSQMVQLTPENLTSRAAQLKAGRARFSSLVNQVAAIKKVDPVLIHAIISQESGYNPGAESHAKARGLMQLMPITIKDLRERFNTYVTNPFDPTQNVNGGTVYLRWLIGEFKGNIGLAVASYNAGSGYILGCGNRVPPKHETLDYVRKVSGFYNAYAKGGL